MKRHGQLKMFEETQNVKTEGNIKQLGDKLHRRSDYTARQKYPEEQWKAKKLQMSKKETSRVNL